MPNVVKGSVQQKMVVVPYRPARRAFYFMVATLAIVGSALAGFGFGYYRTLQSQEVVRLSEDELSAELATSIEENADLRQQVAILERASVMDQRANEEIQETLSSLREQVVRLEQDIVFYRQVVSDEIDSSGMVIGQLDLEGAEDSNQVQYKLVIRQPETDQESYLLGHVNVNVVGSINGEQTVIPLRDVSDDQDDLDIRLRFRYFQNIEGELTLPDGFTPEQIHVTAVSTSPIESQVNKNFSWVVERS